MRKSDVIWNAKAWVFDFDGTLVDSNPIKWGAFESCFSNYHEHLNDIMAYCKSSHHTPRSVKFRYIYEHILKIPYTAECEHELGRRFEEATTRSIMTAPEIRGASKCLKSAHQSRITGLLSSTPEEILIRILKGRGWYRFFNEVKGSPVCKEQWLLSFCKRRGYEGKEVIFFGDTEEDACSAQAAGCVFVAVGPVSKWNQAYMVLTDFKGLYEDIARAL